MVWGEHLKIKKLTFLINAAEVAGVTAGRCKWGVMCCVQSLGLTQANRGSVWLCVGLALP